MQALQNNKIDSREKTVVSLIHPFALLIFFLGSRTVIDTVERLPPNSSEGNW